MRTSFETFAVGPENREASELARQFAADRAGPGLLLLHGADACGKSHLLQAIEKAMVQQANGSTVRCVSTVKFGNEFLGLEPEPLQPSFRAYYRRFSMLLFDDLQSLGADPQVQTEFGAVCGALLRRGGKVCIASRSAVPKSGEIGALATFFGTSVRVAAIRPPNRELRLTILRATARRRGSRFTPAALELLAQQDNWDLHTILGAALCLGHIAKSSGRRVTCPKVMRYIQRLEV
jgi:chromosomal replication initiator protein